jgi:hypothetical protein
MAATVSLGCDGIPECESRKGSPDIELEVFGRELDIL